MREPRGVDAPLPTVLRRVRHQAGMTQEGLAFDADVTIGCMSRIERGLSDPKWTTIRVVARALGISVGELEAAVEAEEAERESRALESLAEGT
jgi:DNA-binding XRE family transcriptional regulator